jgi:hypothetical protein
MKAKSFVELYSERENLPVAKVPERLFHQTLYPHARLIAGILRRLNRRHFVADYEFIEDVGYLHSLHDFSLALGSYIEHPDNRGWLRRTFRIRTSARRMLQIVRTVFGAAQTLQANGLPTGNSLEPFEQKPNGQDTVSPRKATPPA